jgi:phasin family protein
MKKHDELGIPDMSEMVAKTIEQARGAMNNYLQFVQKGMAASPWAGSEQTKRWMDYAERNVAAAFDFAEKIAHAGTFQDVVQLQTEFIQKQMQALSEQAKDLSETATKAAADAFKNPLKPHS